MKRAKLPLITGLMMALLVGGIAFTGGCSQEVSTVGMDTTKPLLDLNKPAITETATFALG